MSALWQLGASELRARVASREVSPVEVTQAVLARVDALQPTLNAFITVCHESALAQAKAAEAAVM
ncbi:MAG TPA: amidase, partial [Burkholderiales bacterium]